MKIKVSEIRNIIREIIKEELETPLPVPDKDDKICEKCGKNPCECMMNGN